VTYVSEPCCYAVAGAEGVKGFHLIDLQHSVREEKKKITKEQKHWTINNWNWQNENERLFPSDKFKITYAGVIKMRIVMTSDSIVDNLQILGRVHVETSDVTNTARNLIIHIFKH
jgi:hypothetical protein